MTLMKSIAFQDSCEKKAHFNLNDIAEQARRMIADAQREAQKLIRDAHDRIEKQLEEARIEGQRQGHEQGLEQGRKEGHDQAFEQARDEFQQKSLAVCQTLQHALVQYDTHKKELLWQAEQGTVALAVAIAQKVIKDAAALHPQVTVNTIQSALELVSQMTNLVIRVHPDHLDTLKQMTDAHEEIINSYKHVRFEPDTAIALGGAVVHTDKGEIDARLDVQINRIAQEILMNTPGSEIETSEESTEKV